MWKIHHRRFRKQISLLRFSNRFQLSIDFVSFVLSLRCRNSNSGAERPRKWESCPSGNRGENFLKIINKIVALRANKCYAPVETLYWSFTRDLRASIRKLFTIHRDTNDRSMREKYRNKSSRWNEINCTMIILPF